MSPWGPRGRARPRRGASESGNAGRRSLQAPLDRQSTHHRTDYASPSCQATGFSLLGINRNHTTCLTSALAVWQTPVGRSNAGETTYTGARRIDMRIIIALVAGLALGAGATVLVVLILDGSIAGGSERKGEPFSLVDEPMAGELAERLPGVAETARTVSACARAPQRARPPTHRFDGLSPRDARSGHRREQALRIPWPGLLPAASGLQ